jgi:hypothetical protein
MVYGSDSK